MNKILLAIVCAFIIGCGSKTEESIPITTTDLSGFWIFGHYSRWAFLQFDSSGNILRQYENPLNGLVLKNIPVVETVGWWNFKNGELEIKFDNWDESKVYRFIEDGILEPIEPIENIKKVELTLTRIKFD